MKSKEEECPKAGLPLIKMYLFFYTLSQRKEKKKKKRTALTEVEFHEQMVW